VYVSYALTGIGLARLALGPSGGDAITPLERALQIRRPGTVPPELRAETMLGLARALWASGRDRARAVALAEAARALFPADRVEDRRLASATLAEWRSSGLDEGGDVARGGPGVRVVRTERRLEHRVRAP
jgi:hypothetical protein